MGAEYLNPREQCVESFEKRRLLGKHQGCTEEWENLGGVGLEWELRRCRAETDLGYILVVAHTGNITEMWVSNSDNQGTHMIIFNFFL